MAAKKDSGIIADTVRRVLFPLIGAILSTMVLIFSVLTMIEVNERSYETAPKYLTFIFIFIGLIYIFAFIKDRTKINLIRCLSMVVFNIALVIIIMFGNKNPYLFSVAAGVYCFALIISRILAMIQNRKVRSFILNGIIITFIAVLAIALLQPLKDTDTVQGIILIECILVAVTAFAEVLIMAVSQLRLKVLGKIILKTYSLEIIFGLLSMMVCFSLIFMVTEPNLTEFPDALWYCFAVVTTIGFGDFVATSLIGRVLTVILGIYGIVVVAVITSIIVNFYNATAGKDDEKEIKSIKNEESQKK